MEEVFVYRKIKCRLTELSEASYAEFMAGLLPGTDNILGVRLPVLRKEAKELVKAREWRAYLEEFNSRYADSQSSGVFFEEIMLAGMIIGLLKPEDGKVGQKAVEGITLQDIFSLICDFIPKIDNWSVCDSFCAGLKIAKEYSDTMWDFLTPYLQSDKEYEIRFAIVMLLNYYIDEMHIAEVFRYMDRIHHEAYYVKMAVAWNLSVCYGKFPEKTLAYLNGNNQLDAFTYNKTLQKAMESLKVSKEEKEVLKSMRRKNI